MIWVGAAVLRVLRACAYATASLDTTAARIHPYYMPIATLRLTAAEKRTFTAEARRRGLTLSEYLRQAGRSEAKRADWKSFFASLPAITLPRGAPSDLSTREGFTS
jgi:hypothetical protein